MAKIALNSEKINSLTELIESDRMTKLALLQNHLEISKILINEIMEDEVRSLAGERYNRDKPHESRYSRWGTNPGSIRIGEEKVRINVPRVRDGQYGKNISLESYEIMKKTEPDEQRLMNGVLSGLSTNDYKGVVQQFADGMGLSRSKVSNRFIEESSKYLKEFTERDISHYNFIALFMDGKYLAKEQVVIALGITEEGNKIPLGFIQTTTENSTSIRQLLSNLIERGLKYEEGLLCIIDGSKGLHKAIEDVFGKYAVIQRCQWHKRENVLSYLKESDQEKYKKKLNKAYKAETYDDAKKQLTGIHNELVHVNKNAANSLMEGLEETLTLHRLELNEMFSKSFSTANVIENLNSQLRKYISKVKFWKNSDQRQRWVASALLRIEKKMRKVDNFRNLGIMKETIMKEVLQCLNN